MQNRDIFLKTWATDTQVYREQPDSEVLEELVHNATELDEFLLKQYTDLKDWFLITEVFKYKENRFSEVLICKTKIGVINSEGLVLKVHPYNQPKEEQKYVATLQKDKTWSVRKQERTKPLPLSYSELQTMLKQEESSQEPLVLSMSTNPRIPLLVMEYSDDTMEELDWRYLKKLDLSRQDLRIPYFNSPIVLEMNQRSKEYIGTPYRETGLIKHDKDDFSSRIEIEQVSIFCGKKEVLEHLAHITDDNKIKRARSINKIYEILKEHVN